MWKDSQWDRSSYATDMVAWDFLLGSPHCSAANTSYPTGHVRWGLAGTAHAVSTLHIDSDGFATFVQVMCGKKLWAVYRPSPKLPLSNNDAFLLSDFFQLDRIPPKATSGLEAVVLRPGDLLYVTILSFSFNNLIILYRLMRPGMPHFVYGLESAITHGGHFYSSSLMQATLQSLVHTFVLSNFISNTFHYPSRQLLRHIVTFWGFGLLEKRITPQGASAAIIHCKCWIVVSDDEYLHLPDVLTTDGLLDLISGCTLAILGNVLDFRTYCAPNQGEADPTRREQQSLWKKFDRNNIPGDERMAICYTRGIALAVFKWIRRWCIVKTPDGEIIEDLPSQYMVALLGSLLAYKSKADQRKLKGAPHCALWMLKAQVSNVVECDRSVKKLWEERKGKSSDTLGITLVEGCTVEWSEDLPISVSQPGGLFV